MQFEIINYFNISKIFQQLKFINFVHVEIDGQDHTYLGIIARLLSI